MKLRPPSKRLRVWLALALLAAGFAAYCTVMPGRSFEGELPAADAETVGLADSLEATVRHLSEKIGERNHHTFKYQRTGKGELEESADYIERQFQAAGYAVERQEFTADRPPQKFFNLVAERKGDAEIVVVGAHYDSVYSTPGADDNASGVAILLELARSLKESKHTVRFVAFTNEEPYYFQTDKMGSLVYARRCREAGAPIVAMLSLETLGYYKDEPGTQKYPFPLGLLYPSRGNFVGFVGNVSSRALTHRVIGSFRRHAQFPSQGAALPSFIPGVGWSDHWSFWKAGYPAVMVTDTAPFRNPHYHQATDKPETLDFLRMARVTTGLRLVLGELVN